MDTLTGHSKCIAEYIYQQDNFLLVSLTNDTKHKMLLLINNVKQEFSGPIIKTRTK
jgi:hypothetical protein